MKPPFHYWFCRIFVIVVWPLMAVTIIYALYDGAKRDDPRVLLMAFAWIPAILLMVRWGLSLSAFGFDFSAFGRYIRSPTPNEAPVATFRQSGAIIGSGMRAPGTLIVYPSGLAMKLYLIGTVFLPFADIEAFEEMRWWVVVHHRCPEVRTPITLPKDVGRAIEELARIPYASASNS